MIQVCKVCEGEGRGGEGVCKSPAKAGRQVGQFFCLLITIFVELVMMVMPKTMIGREPCKSGDRD